jgi:tetratricopeptide (TPR) repeat protein
MIAQNPDEQVQMAQEYYKNKEFDKASTLFLELYNNQKNRTYLTYYISCLMELKEYETAEKTLKKEIKKNNSDLFLLIDLGFLYKTQNLLKDADEQYQKALKLLPPDNNQIILMANAFIMKREYDLAEETYLKGRKMMKDMYGFYFELASLYQAQQLYDKMIEEYLNVLELHDSYLQTVQNRLQASVYSDKENNLTEKLKIQLIKRIQKDPDRIIFSELLIWLYMQSKDYDNAYIQSIALDKRQKEDGTRIMELARQAVASEEYDMAIKAFQYVIDKGKFNVWYTEAKSEYMDALYNKILNKPGVKTAEAINLENLIQQTLDELGWSSGTFNLIKALASIQTFYLNKTDESTKNLEKALEIAKLNSSQIAECKLLLGDIALYSDDIWGATLYYAQVEKANENEPVGHEAKFRKSRLAYFSGDFLWAQAQLDVLKASTSKLIANDAFTLSIPISDNLKSDSIGEALKMFSRAELMSFRHKDSLAILILDSIVKKYSQNAILDDAYYKLGELYLKKSDFQTAINYFDTVATRFNTDLLADDALFKLGNIYEKYVSDKTKAMEYYQKILTSHPGSIYVIEARKRYRFLRGDNISSEENPVQPEGQPY